MSLGRHVQISSFSETFNDIHSCEGSWPEHLRVVFDLESSLRPGHERTDRLASQAIVPLKTARAQDTEIHTIISSVFKCAAMPTETGQFTCVRAMQF